MSPHDSDLGRGRSKPVVRNNRGSGTPSGCGIFECGCPGGFVAGVRSRDVSSRRQWRTRRRHSFTRIPKLVPSRHQRKPLKALRTTDITDHFQNRRHHRLEIPGWLDIDLHAQWFQRLFQYFSGFSSASHHSTLDSGFHLTRMPSGMKRDSGWCASGLPAGLNPVEPHPSQQPVKLGVIRVSHSGQILGRGGCGGAASGQRDGSKAAAAVGGCQRESSRAPRLSGLVTRAVMWLGMAAGRHHHGLPRDATATEAESPDPAGIVTWRRAAAGYSGPMKARLRIDLSCAARGRQGVFRRTAARKFSTCRKATRRRWGHLEYDLWAQRFGSELLLTGSLSAPFEFTCVRTLHPFIQTIRLEAAAISHGDRQRGGNRRHGSARGRRC